MELTKLRKLAGLPESIKIAEAKQYGDSSDFESAVSDVEKHFTGILKTMGSAEWRDWMKSTDSNFGTGVAEDSREIVHKLNEVIKDFDNMYAHMIDVSTQ